MRTASENPAKLADANPARWPIQIRQAPYGWTVTCYNPDGHAKHVLTVNSEMKAYREAHNLAKIYRVENPVLVNTFKGELQVDLDKLLKPRKG